MESSHADDHRLLPLQLEDLTPRTALTRTLITGLDVASLKIFYNDFFDNIRALKRSFPFPIVNFEQRPIPLESAYPPSLAATPYQSAIRVTLRGYQGKSRGHPHTLTIRNAYFNSFAGYVTRALETTPNPFVVELLPPDKMALVLDLPPP